MCCHHASCDSQRPFAHDAGQMAGAGRLAGRRSLAGLVQNITLWLALPSCTEPALSIGFPCMHPFHPGSCLPMALAHVRTRTHTRTRTQTHTCTYTHMHTCSHAHTHTCTHAHTHTCTHAHTHTCTHACTHAHIQVAFKVLCRSEPDSLRASALTSLGSCVQAR